MAWSCSRQRRKTREALRKRDGDNCHICGEAMLFETPQHDNEYATVDHLHPRSHGGKHGLDNLKLAHRRCNIARGNTRLSPPAASPSQTEASLHNPAVEASAGNGGE